MGEILKQQLRKTSTSTKIVISLILVLMLALLIGGAYFITTTYFFKNQSNKGYVTFAPGIYVEFNYESVKINNNDNNDWRLLYYYEGDLTSTPIELNNSNELAYPTKTYSIISPEFKSATNEDGESAPFIARAKLVYKDENNELLSEEKLNYVFSQTMEREENNGILLEFANSWIKGYEDYYYYVGTNSVEGNLEKIDLAEIAYSEDAEYIKIFKTNENNVATLKLANQSLENYQEYAITLVKIELTMEFYEVGSSVIDEWFNA